MPGTGELIGGRYRLGPAIGSGGMGTVRRARDLRFDRDVAIKLLRTSGDPRHEERMRRETRLLGALQHPNLVAAYDTGIDLTDDGPMPWLTMELVRGPDLGVLLRERGRLGSEDVRRILHDVAEALVALHGSGVVHRDLKPANILLTHEPGDRPWHAKLADLGIALAEDTAAITTTGQVMGTAAYLSPEQVSGEDVDAATDVYALGLVALEALTGTHPFRGGPVEAATARLVRPPQIPAWLPVQWRVLLEAMTTIDPRQRPSSGQVARATAAPLPVAEPPAGEQPPVFDDAQTVPFQAMAPTAVLGATPSPPSPSRRRTVPLGIAAAIVLGLAGGGAALLATAPHTHAPAPARHTASPVTVQRTPTPMPTRTVTVVHTVTPTPAATVHRAATAPVQRPPVKHWRPPGHDRGGHGHHGDG
ncbi:MAG: protein kinase domain-containing protein [Amnibacterium sp.]